MILEVNGNEFHQLIGVATATIGIRRENRGRPRQNWKLRLWEDLRQLNPRLPLSLKVHFCKQTSFTDFLIISFVDDGNSKINNATQKTSEVKDQPREQSHSKSECSWFLLIFFQIIWFFVGKDDDKTKHESESEPMDTDQEKKAGLQETEVAGNSKE